MDALVRARRGGGLMGARYPPHPMAAPFTVLIMAAGQGTRMLSDTPKVLHRVAGKSLVEWAADAARAAGAERVVAIVRPGDGVAEGLPHGVEVAEQREGEGTGAAVLAARDAVLGEGGSAGSVDPGAVVVLSADHPLITPEQLEGILDEHARKDARATLGLEQGERYLTGVFPLIREEGGTIAAHMTDDAAAALGINDRLGLMAADESAQRRIIETHARAGVTFLQPGTTRVEAGVTIGRDSTIAPGTVLEGTTVIGERCEIGPHTTARDATIRDGATVVHSFVLEAEVGAGAKVGPFAYLRPGTLIGEGAKVGTFVEIKNSEIGSGAKVPHLSYIGDADVGEDSNLGASTITANYDGRKKHRTKLGKSVKTGIHTSLVAPLNVGDRAYTGAGSTINEDVPDGALGIARAKQKNIEGYADRVEEDSQK